MSISAALAVEVAETWETMAEMEATSKPGRRETLRECADMVRMLAGRAAPSDDTQVGIGPLADEPKVPTGDAEGGVVGWQDWSSAPNDSTKFDAWCVHPEAPTMGVRFTDVQMRGDGSGFGYVVHCRGETVWQYLDARDGGAGFPAWLPTHWRSVPDAPSTTAGSE